jgi:hypothetical protein
MPSRYGQRIPLTLYMLEYRCDVCGWSALVSPGPRAERVGRRRVARHITDQHSEVARERHVARLQEARTMILAADHTLTRAHAALTRASERHERTRTVMGLLTDAPDAVLMRAARVHGLACKYLERAEHRARLARRDVDAALARADEASQARALNNKETAR